MEISRDSETLIGFARLSDLLTVNINFSKNIRRCIFHESIQVIHFVFLKVHETLFLELQAVNSRLSIVCIF